MVELGSDDERRRSDVPTLDHANGRGWHREQLQTKATGRTTLQSTQADRRVAWVYGISLCKR